MNSLVSSTWTVWVQGAEMNWDEDPQGREHMTSGSWSVGKWRVCGRILRMKMSDTGSIWRRGSWLFVAGRGGYLLWIPCVLGQMSFSGGLLSGALGVLGWVGGTMECCSRPGLVQADHCP